MATVSDTFVEVSTNTNLESHVPTGANAGTSWVKEQQTGAALLRVLSAGDNVAANSVEAAKNIIHTIRPNPTNAEYDVSFRVTDINSGGNPRPVYMVARFIDVSNYYAALTYRPLATTDKAIYKVVAGVPTLLASGDAAIVNGDLLTFEMRNGNKRLLLNGTPISGLTTADADAALTAAGRAGIGMGNGLVATDDIGGFTIDDFSYVEVVSAASTFPWHYYQRLREVIR